jgi:hypothetical protein
LESLFPEKWTEKGEEICIFPERPGSFDATGNSLNILVKSYKKRVNFFFPPDVKPSNSS